MRKILDRRSTPAFVIAVLALIVATSSTAAYAAVKKNSVVSTSIKNGQVKAVDLGASSVTSPKIKDGQVLGADLGANAVTSAKIANGSISGADLGENAVGAQHLAEMAIYQNTSAAVGDADGQTNGGTYNTVEVTAACPVGWRALSGGAAFVDASSGTIGEKNVYLHSSTSTGTGWYARGIVDIGAQGTVKLRAYAHCLPKWPQPQN